LLIGLLFLYLTIRIFFNLTLMDNISLLILLLVFGYLIWVFRKIIQVILVVVGVVSILYFLHSVNLLHIPDLTNTSNVVPLDIP
jgi:hypothetical protein